MGGAQYTAQTSFTPLPPVAPPPSAPSTVVMITGSLAKLLVPSNINGNQGGIVGSGACGGEATMNDMGGGNGINAMGNGNVATPPSQSCKQEEWQLIFGKFHIVNQSFRWDPLHHTSIDMLPMVKGTFAKLFWGWI